MQSHMQFQFLNDYEVHTELKLKLKFHLKTSHLKLCALDYEVVYNH